MDEEKLVVDFTVPVSACAALLWFLKPTGFQDSAPGVGFGWFGAETWVGPCSPPSFLSSSPAKNRASEGVAVKEEAQGWCGPQP